MGIERAKKMITFCFNDRAHRTDQDDFNLLLSIVEGEGEIDDDCENKIDDCEECKRGNVDLPCWICDWQTSTSQPSQGITTRILNFLFGMTILYLKNLSKRMCIVFIGQVWRIYKFKKAKVAFKTMRDTQQSFPEP
jgi:hypothetical protein